MNFKALLPLMMGLLLAVPAWAEMVGAPGSLNVPVSDPDGGYSVSWTTSPTGGAQYVLEEATDPGFGESTVVYQGKATKANLKGRLAGYIYHYRVKATLTGFEDSDWAIGGNGCDVPFVVQVKPAKGGTITPYGQVEVPVGETQSIAITPEVGYHVASVVVDGVELGDVASVTLPDDLVSNPKNKHAIKVKFAFNSYQATATAGEGGSITPVGTKTFKHGKKATYTIKPNSGQTITSLLVNGEEVLPNPLPSGVYKLPLVIEEPTTIQAFFLQAAPPTDLNVPASDDDGDFTVSWSASATAGVTYRLEEATDSGFTSNLRNAYSGAETSAPITGRSAGTTYFYRVKAIKAGLADSPFAIADYGCQCVALPVTDEGLLIGDPSSQALSVITFYNAITGIPADEIGTDTAGVQVALTELEIKFADGATVGEVNTVLASIDGKITFLLDGVPIILVRIPNPGSVPNLDALVAQLESDPAVRLVRKGYFPAPDALPDNHADLASLSRIAHHLAVRAHGVWNVRSLLGSAYPPHLVVADYFGDGAPFTDFAFWLPDASEFATGSRNPHGYHVLGIIGADYDDETSNDRQKITGIYPGVLTLSAVDLVQHGGPGDPQFSWPATEDLILSRIRNASGRVILNTSFGFGCRTPDTVQQQCTLEHAAVEGLSWVEKVRDGGLEHKFLHVTSAGNTSVAGDTDTRFNSPFTAARLLLGTLPPPYAAVPPLGNTLVVENLIATGSPPQPRCLSGDVTNGYASKYHGDLSAVGTNVWSLIGATNGVEFMTGTSMAAPQVAGLAAYVWALNPLLTNLEVIEILKDTARMVELNVGADPSCGGIPPAKVIDAYAAVLASDTNIAQAKVRRELLDVADVSGAPGSDGSFNEKDVQMLVDILDVQNGILDYSRYDLNGDGRTGGDTVERFDLNLDRAYARVSQIVEDEGVEFNEAEVTDDDILCYYAYSPLYDGDTEARKTILDGRCGLGKIEVVIGTSYSDKYLVGASTTWFSLDSVIGAKLSPEGGVPLMSVGPGCQIEGAILVREGENLRFNVSDQRVDNHNLINVQSMLDVQVGHNSTQLTYSAEGELIPPNFFGGGWVYNFTAETYFQPYGLIYLLIDNPTNTPIELEANWHFDVSVGIVDNSFNCDGIRNVSAGAYIFARESVRSDAVLYCDTPADWRLYHWEEGEMPTHDTGARADVSGASGTTRTATDSATDTAIVPIPPGRHLIEVWPRTTANGNSSGCYNIAEMASASGTVTFRLRR